MSTALAPTDRMLLGTANSDGTFTGVSADETYSVWVQPGQYDRAAIVVIGNGTISGGVVSIQEAFWTETQAPYTGTPSLVTTVTASDVSGGAQEVVHIAPNALFPIRVGITTAIAGGGGISVALRYQ